jgi:hypothetical protein
VRGRLQPPVAVFLAEGGLFGVGLDMMLLAICLVASVWVESGALDVEIEDTWELHEAFCPSNIPSSPSTATSRGRPSDRPGL